MTIISRIFSVKKNLKLKYTKYTVQQRVNFKLALLVYKALHDATAAYLVDDCQLVSHAGRRRPTSTRAAFHRPVQWQNQQ